MAYQKARSPLTLNDCKGHFSYLNFTTHAISSERLELKN